MLIYAKKGLETQDIVVASGLLGLKKAAGSTLYLAIIEVGPYSIRPCSQGFLFV